MKKDLVITRNRFAIVCYWSLCCLIVTGCQSLSERTNALRDSSRDLFTRHKKEALKPCDTAARMVVIWSESTSYGANQVATRGIGGRIFLYNANHQAVEADGELVVYAYDDGSDEEKVTGSQVCRHIRRILQALQSIRSRPLLQHLDSLGRSGQRYDGH